MPFGRHAMLYDGSADFAVILREEVSGRYIERVPGEKPGDVLVMGRMFNTLLLSTC